MDPRLQKSQSRLSRPRPSDQLSKRLPVPVPGASGEFNSSAARRESCQWAQLARAVLWPKLWSSSLAVTSLVSQVSESAAEDRIA
ncbi:hypothetical protein M440DRAFT_1406668 [Trichoderma longibrachiatum ATCC 18648]|uniref:Uncharacterized protein n=1 Tax=Trichoderma longibrachiatum ATCC 18648 TaxID=983965 RepID=A0A2T4BPV3_TRILO|nr:hypothetical protein M440DRAFT_1406668 [Trichoderma longibrachiatum ATCC 18648]